MLCAQPTKSSLRRFAGMDGVNVRSIVRAFLSASASVHTPAVSPARYAAPSAVLSVTAGRSTLQPSTSAWNCIKKLLAHAPPSTARHLMSYPASLSIACMTSTT